MTLARPGLPPGTPAVPTHRSATGPTAPSTLTVYPGGQPLPLASNLNFVAGQTIPNMVLVGVGPNNTVTFRNSAGTVNVIADLLGHFAPGTGGGFTGGTPTRVLDTRTTVGGHPSKLGPGQTLTVPQPGRDGTSADVGRRRNVTHPTHTHHPATSHRPRA